MDRTERGLDQGKIKSESELLNMYYLSYSEVSRTVDTPLYLRKEQKINDRLHDKINILKTQTQLQDQGRTPLQSTHSKDYLNRAKDQANISKDSSLHSFLRKSKET